MRVSSLPKPLQNVLADDRITGTEVVRVVLPTLTPLLGTQQLEAMLPALQAAKADPAAKEALRQLGEMSAAFKLAPPPALHDAPAHDALTVSPPADVVARSAELLSYVGREPHAVLPADARQVNQAVFEGGFAQGKSFERTFESSEGTFVIGYRRSASDEMVADHVLLPGGAMATARDGKIDTVTANGITLFQQKGYVERVYLAPHAGDAQLAKVWDQLDAKNNVVKQSVMFNYDEGDENDIG